MKALSIRQPWASMIIWGLKSLEVRSWSTQYRGPLYIHAARTVDEAACARLGIGGLPVGALIGIVTLVDIVKFTSETWLERADEHMDVGSYAPRLLGWQFVDPRPLDEPVPYRGDRGLFSIARDSGGVPLR